MSKRARADGSRSYHSPEKAFQHATSLLNTADLLALWKVSARLSLHETYTRPEHALSTFPMLNFEKVRLFGNVILASRADHGRPRIPTDEELRNVFNDCVNMTANPESMARLTAANGTGDVHLAMQLFMAQMANVQFPGQNPRSLERAGRLVAMLELLPTRNPQNIPAAQKEMVKEVLTLTERILGATPLQLAQGFVAILRWQSLTSLVSLRVLSQGCDLQV